MRSHLLSALVVANALAVLLFLYADGVIPPAPPRAAPPMLIVAHRGDVTQYPEDTLEAIIGAAAAGADGVEFDVGLSASGTWWVLHDTSVDRTTNGSGSLESLSDDEIEALVIDGGRGYRADDPQVYRLATLENVLNALNAYPSLAIYLDVKDERPAAHRAIAELFAERDGRRSIICRNLDGAAAVKQADPTIRTLMLADLAPPPASPVLDAWLANRTWVTRPDVILGKSYDVEVYVDSLVGSTREADALRRSYDWNAIAFLTNDVPDAVALRDELASD